MSLSLEQLVGALMRDYGLDRPTAERRALRALAGGVPLPRPAESYERDRNIAEKEEQRVVRRMFRACGMIVYWLSQPRTTKQTPGIGDLYVFYITEPYNRDHAFAFWWETKRQIGGKLSPDQVEFQELCHKAGAHYGHGDRYAARDWLVRFGIRTFEEAQQLMDAAAAGP